VIMVRRDRLVSLARMSVVVVLFAPLSAAAQFETGLAPFTLALDPLAPRAHTEVTITPISGQIDISTATMTVTAAGKQVYSGAARPTAVTVGNVGQNTAVVVTMKVGSATYTQKLSLVPQDVSLIIEPLSSAPPLYLGKPLVPLDGSVRVVAVADLRTSSGTQLDPLSLGYTWSVDGVTALNGSGVGRRVLIVDSPLQYRARNVSVTVTSPDRLYSAAASVDFAAAEPTIRVYERHSLLGIRYDRALGGSYALPGSEGTFYAAPYSFPTALRPVPALEWYVSDILAQAGNLITLRPTGQGAGSASVVVRGAGGPSAVSSTGFTVTYGSSGGSGFFGL
jgi:hypothetical protein